MATGDPGGQDARNYDGRRQEEHVCASLSSAVAMVTSINSLESRYQSLENVSASI